MRVAFYENAQGSIPRVEDLDWPSLVAMLTTHRRSDRCASIPCADKRCSGKNGPAWSPVELNPCPTPCRNHELVKLQRERNNGRATSFDCGGGQLHRHNDNVRAITVGVFDLDHLTEERVDALDLRDLAWVLHSTHSSKPGDISLRLVIPLSRPVLPQEWAAVRAAAVAELDLPADPSTKDRARLYYLPDAPEGTEPLAASADGKPLDVDALLESARAGLGARSTQAASEPLPIAHEANGHPTDLHELATVLRANCKPENRALVSRVLRGEPLSPPRSGPYGGQDNELQALMSTAAFCLPNDTPDEVVLHLMRPSFVRTNWEDGQQHLETEALKKLHRARERKIARDAERLAKNKEIRDRLGMREPEKPAEPQPVDEGMQDPEAWVQQLITIESKNGVTLKNCEANVELVLRCSLEWRGVLRFNEVSKEIEVLNAPTGPLRSLDTLDAEIAVWFQRSDYGRLGLMPKPQVVRECVKVVAHANAVDPLRDHLEALVWDGVPRADSLLAKYFGAEGEEKYLRAIGAKWLISAVARALRPGCKVDTVLILEGLQGLGKSSAFRALGAAWFSDASIDIGNKDSAALASQFWILELAELQSVRRSDAEALKAFLSRNEDTYRPPYGRVNVRVPRRCVFVGTTNADGYLKHDPSGYRRYWPVKCTKVALADLKRDAPQIWAEAVARFNAGEQWWLNDEEALLAEDQAAIRGEDAGGPDEAILTWLLSQPKERRTQVTTDSIAGLALGFTTPQITRGVRMEVGSALRRLGFRRAQRRVAGVVTWVFLAPESILEAPQTAPGAKPSPLAVIAGARAG